MEKLDFIQQFRAFIRASAGVLNAREQAVYVRLLGIWNELRRPEWFAVSINQLKRELKAGSNHTIINAKRGLEERGFVQTRNDRKTGITWFKVVEIACAKNAQDKPAYAENAQDLCKNDTSAYAENAQELVQKMHTSQRSKDSKNTEIAAASPDFAEAVNFFSNNIHPITGEVEMQKLASFLDDYGKDWTLAAIEEAAESNGRSVKYIGSILERWKRDGFKSDRKGKRYGQSIPGGARPSAAEKMRAEQAKWDAQTSGWE